MINVSLLYPIGSIYLSIKPKNPSEIFGGVWEKIAQGRTLVGVDENDTDFSFPEKTGGEKMHTLVHNEMPAHAHNETTLSLYGYPNNLVGNDANVVDSNITRSGGGGYNSGGGWQSKTGTQNQTDITGGSQAHNNLQPYFTCYIFVRTA